VGQVRQYTPPPSLHDWPVPRMPLLIVEMQVNLKRKRKATIKEIKEESQEEVLFYEPSLAHVEEALVAPLRMVRTLTDQFTKLESFFIPLIGIPHKPSYVPVSDQDSVKEALFL
jgi:hypothetical protein